MPVESGYGAPLPAKETTTLYAWSWDKTAGKTKVPAEISAIAPTVAHSGADDRLVLRFTDPGVDTRGVLYPTTFTPPVGLSTLELELEVAFDAPVGTETVEFSLAARPADDDAAAWVPAVALPTFLASQEGGNEWKRVTLSATFASLGLTTGSRYRLALIHTGGTHTGDFSVDFAQIRAE